jgi:hypothetical protein
MSSNLVIVRPLSITDAMLISTNVAENDHAAWAAGTTYAQYARVILTSTHKVYESLQASNTGNNPATAAAWWIEVSPTNRWKVFDGANSTQTAQATSITYTLRPATSITALALLNVTGATSLTATVTDPTFGAVFSKTFDFTALPLVSTWHAWFFGTRRAPRQWISLDLPSYPNADIAITLSGGASLAVGVILLGQQQRFGMAVNHGARVGITDYSRKETNDFGDTVLVQRAFAKRATLDVSLPPEEVDTLQASLADLRAVPALWVAESPYESAVLYGFYKNFEITISYALLSECQLDLEGLT